MALPTKGRVIIETTVGEIDIELWAKETPKTCRNFIALAMEGYYDGVIFHRIVPNFLVQTGDRTGTGGGGESFYGEPFEDEIHPRLRFAHRGLVAMANNGTKNSNDSQFFITLDRAEELHGKHTLFGRCMGDTVYNVMKIGEMEIDENERPVYPPKIKSIRIVDNPFDDIVPRITAAEKRAQQKAKEQVQKERDEMERRKGAKKNVKLLSFGADEDATEENEPVAFKKKAIFRPDLVDNPLPATVIPDFVSQPSVSVPSSAPKTTQLEQKSERKDKGKQKEDDITKIREKHAQEQAAGENSRRAEIAKMEAEIRSLTKRREGGSDDDVPKRKKPKKSYLEEEMAKYSKGKGLHAKKSKGKGKRDEGDVLAALDSFRGMLRGVMDIDKPEEKEGDEPKEGEDEGTAIEEGIEVDDDTGFMSHALHFPKDNTEETNKAERDYEVIDPRARGARAKEEERERKRLEKNRKGRGGSRGGGGGYRH
ncbi:cyclophilin-like domain-containing protein [Crucibulum laeve]|uniref:Peptidyl-prolyl isomerase CWC27 n=1 Tax=Crucibulum laeve TaxID=68775 RepID=A0A5C3MEJ0_9AGAR|nr:cyclophilin-like domain-containing protein [Crucibulum laeve]